jgi:hypothetical protein
VKEELIARSNTAILGNSRPSRVLEVHRTFTKSDPKGDKTRRFSKRILEHGYNIILY